jgi:hypothetical protein
MTYKQNLNKILKLLNDFGKEYTIEYWGNGEGVNIIVKESEGMIDGTLEEYTQTISLNENDYLQFEKQENKPQEEIEEVETKDEIQSQENI